jgi:hypothetical protein
VRRRRSLWRNSNLEGHSARAEQAEREGRRSLAASSAAGSPGAAACSAEGRSTRRKNFGEHRGRQPADRSERRNNVTVFACAREPWGPSDRPTTKYRCLAIPSHGRSAAILAINARWPAPRFPDTVSAAAIGAQSKSVGSDGSRLWANMRRICCGRTRPSDRSAGMSISPNQPTSEVS